MKLILLKNKNCLASTLMYRYLQTKGVEFDIISVDNVPSLIDVFDLKSVPALITTDDYSTFNKLEGYSDADVDEFLKDVKRSA